MTDVLAIVRRQATDDAVALVSPAPGWFRIAVQIGDVVHPGSMLGHLESLGRVQPVRVPADAHGAVTTIVDRVRAGGPSRVAVGHGSVLCVLDPRATTQSVAASATRSTSTTGGLVFRAPTGGRYYGRPAPDKPAFVTVGDELAHGATVCLLEVMKTFHRVQLGGELPERVRVTQLLVHDGDDVGLGDPVLALEAIA